MLLGLAGKERDAERLRLADVGRQLRQHGDAAGDVEAADADRQPGREERPREIDRARELVRLHADQADQRLAAGLPDHADDAVGPNAPVGLVIGVQADLDAFAQHAAPLRVLGEAVEAGERIGRDRRPDPLDRIAVVVIVRRLDHHEMKQARTVGRLLNHQCVFRRRKKAIPKATYITIERCEMNRILRLSGVTVA